VPITITMPALSPTMTAGTLARWLVKEGDKIAAGKIIAEIETDKATMEYEAVDDGVVGKLLVPAGTENVAVNAPIAIILQEGESAASATTPAPSKAAAPTNGKGAPPSPQPSPVSRERMPSVGAAGGGRVFASPLARRLAAQASLDLARISGSGPRGRIIKADIERAGPGAAAAPARMAAPTPMAAPVPMPPPAPGSLAPSPGTAYTEVPLNNFRKVAARRLTEAKQTIPHFYLTIDCAIDELLALRQKVNAVAEGAKVSVNDFIIRAVALALVKVPDANASFGGDRIYRYSSADVAVAVAIEHGLITPIVRNAQTKSVLQISAEMKDLGTRARAGKLKLEEFQGGTFTVSNLGMFGIKQFDAVINPPQACILAVGAGEQRAVVKDGQLAVATLMTCTLSVDHRAVDGALGAKFLAAFKDGIEKPLSLLL
jgi:pyruvate dehydrogenase E2 component (dihydrolipoamide acetyltransferase)